MTERVLVTGGAGFIGSRVVWRLLDRGASVTVLDNLSVGRRESVPDGATLVQGDVRDEERVRRLVPAHDAVIHLAAVVSIRASLDGFYDDAETNLMGTLNVLRSLPDGQKVRLILASSMAVYADADTPEPIPETHPTRPLAPYGVSKLAAEQNALIVSRLKESPCVVLRYFNTYGPGQAVTPYVGVVTIFIRRLLAGQPPLIFGDGDQRRDFVHVEDVAEATVLALDANLDQAVLNIGSGRGVTVNEIARLLGARIAPGIEPVHRAPVPGELRYSVADITRARQGLGYHPRHTLEDSIDPLIAWHRERVVG